MKKHICITTITLVGAIASYNFYQVVEYNRAQIEMLNMEITAHKETIKKLNNKNETIRKKLTDLNSTLNAQNQALEHFESMAYIRAIKLPIELQKYTYELCKEYDVDYDLVLAMMKVESNFQSHLINENRNGTKDYGLMQINTVNHEHFREVLGIRSFLEPKSSILCGVYKLSHLMKKYEDETMALLCYNLGETGAKRFIESGGTKTLYAKKVQNEKEKIQKGGY